MKANRLPLRQRFARIRENRRIARMRITNVAEVSAPGLESLSGSGRNGLGSVPRRTNVSTPRGHRHLSPTAERSPRAAARSQRPSQRMSAERGGWLRTAALPADSRIAVEPDLRWPGTWASGLGLPLARTTDRGARAARRARAGADHSRRARGTSVTEPCSRHRSGRLLPVGRPRLRRCRLRRLRGRAATRSSQRPSRRQRPSQSQTPRPVRPLRKRLCAPMGPVTRRPRRSLSRP